MTRCLKLFACLTTTLCAGAALAQTGDEPETTSSPVAYVYVSRPTHIDAFAASTTGKLTAVPGSPFSGSVSSMSVNGKFLLAQATMARISIRSRSGPMVLSSRSARPTRRSTILWVAAALDRCRSTIPAQPCTTK